MNKLSEYLHKIADQLTPNNTIEDVYKLLALFEDIDISESQITNGEVYTQAEVQNLAKEWLK